MSVFVKGALDVAGAENVRVIANSNSTYQNGDSTSFGSSEVWAELHMLVDPDTSSAWTESGVNALQGGVETL